MSLKEEQRVRKEKPKFPDEYHLIDKLYSPLSVLYYNLNFHFEDDYPAKMPEGFATDMVTLYSKEGDIVWDGCCGSGTVPRTARNLGRIGIGSDVNDKSIKLSLEHEKKNPRYIPNTHYIVKDSREVDCCRDFGFGYPNLIISSLPFGLNIIGDKNNYSETPGDISNDPDYETFFKHSKEIIKSYYDNLAPNGICVLDARDRLHNGKTICLINKFLNQAEEVGFELVTRFYYVLIPYRQMTYKHKPDGHIRAMPAAMDAIVLVKLAEKKLTSFAEEEQS